VNRATIISLSLIAAIALLVPAVITDSYSMHVLIICLVFAVVASNWDLSMGHAGVFNFAHLAFFGVGAYTSGILAKLFGLSPWLGLFLGGFAAVLTSLLIGLPTLRLRGMYVAIFTFAFTQVLLSLVLIWSDLTGGSFGLSDIPPLQIGSVVFAGANKVAVYYLLLAIFLISTCAIYVVVRSSVGLAFVTLRDSQDYAVSRGISAYRYRLIAFVVSSFFTGVIGAFYAHYLEVVTVEIFGWNILSLALAMVIVGGLGTTRGPIIGAFFMTLVSEYLRSFFAYRLLLVGIILFLVLVFAPGGIDSLARSGIRRSRKLLGFFAKR